ncbi:MAG: YfjI family protein [Pararobbsia sp.]
MSFEVTPPPYPLGAFHLIIKDAADEVWRNTQAPDALIGMELLMAMSASAQGLYDVRLPTGHVRPIAVFTVAVGDSGERKSGVHHTVAAPIYDFDATRMKKYESDLKEYELQNRIWKSIDAGMRRQLTKATQNNEPIGDLCRQLSNHAADKPLKPRARRIMRQNATERAIMDALEGDGEAIAFISDEGEIIIKGGALNQTGMLNKAWDGAAMLTLDRSEGVSVVVRNPRVTVSYMVQRQVLKDLLDRRGDAMRGSGHWARYLIGCPTSTQGTRYTFRLDKEWRHLTRFHERMRELLDEFGRRLDADVAERTTLEFADDVNPRWIEVANHMETMLQPSGYMHDIKDFASKALEIAARVAALLHVFSKQEGRISVDTLNRAITIVEWHLHEFKRIFSPPTIPQEHADAQVLEHYLFVNYWCRNFTFAQKNLVLRNGPIRPASRLDAALACLTGLQRVWISVGPKRERYINLNPGTSVL